MSEEKPQSPNPSGDEQSPSPNRPPEIEVQLVADPREMELYKRFILCVQPRPMVSLILIFSFVFILWQIAKDAGISVFDFWWVREEVIFPLLHWGAARPELLEMGQTWRLVTSAFVHLGLIHLLINSYALYQLGGLAENLYGKRNYLIAFFTTAAGSSAFHYYMATGPYVAGGASGGLFGVIGLLLVFTIRYREEIPRDIAKSIFNNLAFITILMFALGYGIGEIKGAKVGNLAHLGGLISGVIIGLLVVPVGLGVKENKFAEGLSHILLLLVIGFGSYSLYQIVPSSENSLDSKSTAKQMAANIKMETYINPWFEIDFPKSPIRFETVEQRDEGVYSLNFRPGNYNAVSVAIRPRRVNEDIVSHIDLFMEGEVSRLKEKGKEFFKIQRSEVTFQYNPGEDAMVKTLRGKKFGIRFVQDDDRWAEFTRVVLFTDDLVFRFDYLRLESDKLAEQIFIKMQKSLVIKQTDKLP